MGGWFACKRGQKRQLLLAPVFCFVEAIIAYMAAYIKCFFHRFEKILSAVTSRNKASPHLQLASPAELDHIAAFQRAGCVRRDLPAVERDPGLGQIHHVPDALPKLEGGVHLVDLLFVLLARADDVA